MEILEELRSEYARLGIGTHLHQLLEKIVWSTVHQYPASEYSSSGVWDQMACEDVLNDWILERLWGRADLQAMLAAASSPKQLKSGLTTSLRQHLTNKRRRSIASNLYKRARSLMLSERAFLPLGIESLGAQQPWTLSERPTDRPSDLSMRELLRIACDLDDDALAVVRYGLLSQKLSPILREPKLREFLMHLLGRAGGSLTLAEIMDVMRLRFSLPTEEHVELDDSVPTTTSDPVDDAADRIRANSVVARLNLDEARLLETYFRSGGNVMESTASFTASPQATREAVSKAVAMVCDCADSLEDARAIMQSVELLLLSRGA